MNIIVRKYGGKSVGSLERIREVASQIVEIHKRGVGLVVVVSAMADTTDQLLRYASEISKNPPQRELDMLVSAGERISMALLSIAIADLGHSAISFTGSQSGIITDDVHTRARIVEIRCVRIIEQLQRGKIVIVAGFQGVSGKKEITTLGRGGSDTTAVALACALGAERCEIFSDVDGVYSADPKKIKNATHIPEMNYDVLCDMTFFGAKVVDMRAVQLALKYNMPLFLASSLSGEKNTMVTSKSMEGAGFIAVSSRQEIIFVTASLQEKMLEKFFSEMDRMRINICSPNIAFCGDHLDVSFWIQPSQAKETYDLLTELVGTDGFRAQEASIVAVTGHGIADSAEAISSVTKVIETAGLPFIQIGTTNHSIYMVMPIGYVSEAEELLHSKLIERKRI